MTDKELFDEHFPKEDLLEELRPYVGAHGTIPMLRHPLVYIVFFNESLLAGYANNVYRYKTDGIRKAIAAGNWTTAVFLHERPYRFSKFIEYSKRIPDKQYWELLGAVWVDCENHFEYGYDQLLRLLTAKRSYRQFLMNNSEHGTFANMPETLTIYRGCQERNIEGLSWTLSHAKAEWFAKRFANPETRLIIEGRIAKDDVIAYFAGRGEEEIVADWNDVEIVAKHQI